MVPVKGLTIEQDFLSGEAATSLRLPETGDHSSTLTLQLPNWGLQVRFLRACFYVVSTVPCWGTNAILPRPGGVSFSRYLGSAVGGGVSSCQSAVPPVSC
jgi:hypothetical protein